MRTLAPPLFLALPLALVLAACSSLPGQSKDKLDPPQVLLSPYSADTQGDAIWAVVPLANESGASAADPYMISDKLAAAIDEVQGVTCLPVNRTIAGMRARGLSALRTPADARLLAETLGADAIVIGSITAYDPYDPPKLGLALALYAKPRERGGQQDNLDPMQLQSAYSDEQMQVRAAREPMPVATVSEHLDGANHAVQAEIRMFATGRHDPKSAAGWRAVLMDMDRFTEFAAYATVSRLLDQERLRVANASEPGR